MGKVPPWSTRPGRLSFLYNPRYDKSIMRNFKIYPCITGHEGIDWQSQLKEINQFGIKEVAVFVEWFNEKERPHLYKFLKKSVIEKVPFVHLRHDTDKTDVEFFMQNFKTQHFNIHEEHFDILDNWKGYEDKLYLEMNYDGKIDKDVKVRQIGGFCIDLSHFKSAIARGSEEAAYAFERRGKVNFACNHCNGYNPDKMEDKHTISDLKDFDYLITLPKYVFGKIIALEVNNSITDQMKYIEHLNKLLGGYLNDKKD